MGRKADNAAGDSACNAALYDVSPFFLNKGYIMLDFHELKHYNKERDLKRGSFTENFLNKNGIEYTCPAKGHYKIKSKSCIALMFYSKSGVIVFRKSKADRQHKFKNADQGIIARKLKQLIEE